MLDNDAEPRGSQSLVSAYADIRTFPPYFASPPVVAGTDLAAAALGTGVLAVPLLELLLGFDGAAAFGVSDFAGAWGASASSDPQATATINKNAVNIGRRVLTLSNLSIDM